MTNNRYLSHVFVTNNRYLSHVFVTNNRYLSHVFVTNNRYISHVFVTKAPFLLHFSHGAHAYCHGGGVVEKRCERGRYDVGKTAQN